MKRKPGAEDTGSSSESLHDCVTRDKHRWLKHVMYDPVVSSTEKCLAYAVMDRLNCVTLDAWPSQSLIAQGFGCESIKTVRRASLGLEKRGYLRVTRNARGSCRYAPIFLPSDEDKSVANPGQNCPSVPDKTVEESYLVIPFNLSSPIGAESVASNGSNRAAPAYNPRQRGGYEIEVARLLGKDGNEILEKLAEVDDAIVERLCRAYANRQLGPREITAARLAAEQLPKKRRLT